MRKLRDASNKTTGTSSKLSMHMWQIQVNTRSPVETQGARIRWVKISRWRWRCSRACRCQGTTRPLQESQTRTMIWIGFCCSLCKSKRTMSTRARMSPSIQSSVKEKMVCPAASRTSATPATSTRSYRFTITYRDLGGRSWNSSTMDSAWRHRLVNNHQAEVNLRAVVPELLAIPRTPHQWMQRRNNSWRG